MRRGVTGFIQRILLFLVFAAIFISCGEKPKNGLIIFTRVPSLTDSVNYLTGESWRYIPGSEICLADPSHQGKKPVILTTGFSSARSPEISTDGKRMIFAGQLKEGDPWQIWEMKLSNHIYKKVSSFNDNCTDPAYLPLDKIVFSRSAFNDTTGLTHNLYTCNTDGSDVSRITFHPHADFAPMVLADGRILEITRQVYPSASEPMLYVLRPDGTKADTFYPSMLKGELTGKASEGRNGTIYYVQSDNGMLPSGKLYSINQNRPLNSVKKIATEKGGNYLSVSSGQNGKLIVTFRPDGVSRFGLYELDPETNRLSEPIYSEKDYHIIEAVFAEEYPRQRILPSEVDLQVMTGQIMCQDINIVGPVTLINNVKKAHIIEVLGIAGSLGKVEVEEDGSFYLKPLADMPFRIQTIDEEGNVMNGPSGWMWLRPNERRGCVGCHEDPELVPYNRVPVAVKKNPVGVPVHVNKIREKSVELE